MTLFRLNAQIEHCVEELLQGGYVWWLFPSPKSSSNAIAQIGVNELCQIGRAADGSGIGKSRARGFHFIESLLNMSSEFAD